MPDGLHSIASALGAQQVRMDALANDIANSSTPGYKSQRVAFRDLEYQNGLGEGTAAAPIGLSYEAGPVQPSDNPLALAIDGPGFFQVKLADGRTALTRSGDFRLDAGGALVGPGGERLQPPVTVPPLTQPQDIR